MSTKSKTRFTIKNRNDGVDRLLLSVRQLKDQSLLLIPKRGQYALTQEVDRPEFVEVHFSVHNSPNSSGNMLKKTSILSDGTQEVLMQMTSAMPNGLFNELYGEVRPRMDTPHYEFTPKRGDQVIKMGSYDHHSTMLVLVVFVSNRGLNLRIASENLHIAYADFDRYRISVLYSLIALPSIEDGAIVATAKPSTKTKMPLPMLPGRNDQGVVNIYQYLREALRVKMLEYIAGLSRSALTPEQVIKKEE